MTLIPLERVLLQGGQPVSLTPPKAFELLAFLAANPGRLLTKDELLQAVWPDAVAGWWYRRRPEIHKRLMLVALLLLTAVPLLHLAGYVIGRRPDLFGPASVAPFAANLLLFAGAVHDKVTRGRIDPVSLWVPVGLIAVATLTTVAIAPSAPWRQFSAWLAG